MTILDFNELPWRLKNFDYSNQERNELARQILNGNPSRRDLCDIIIYAQDEDLREEAWKKLCMKKGIFGKGPSLEELEYIISQGEFWEDHSQKVKEGFYPKYVGKYEEFYIFSTPLIKEIKKFLESKINSRRRNKLY